MSSNDLAKVALPYHGVLSPPSTLPVLTLLSASAVTLLSASSGRLLAQLPCALTVPVATDVATHRYTLAPHCSCPRLAAWSRVTSTEDGRYRAAYLAVIGDDKGLRVFRIIYDESSGMVQGLQYGSEVFAKQIPKRASEMAWENNGQILVVADKHGDVRAFALPTDDEILDETTPAKRQRTELPEPAVETLPQSLPEEEQVEDEDDHADPTLLPLLGHVSMITTFLLPRSPGSSSPPSSIITADRDEHIRVSRWGRERQGFVIERYLLGSTGAVGALALVPQAPGYLKGALISSDGGETIRIWDWSRANTPRVVVDLGRETMGKFVGVEKEREKRREQGRPLDRPVLPQRGRRSRGKGAAQPEATAQATEEASAAVQESLKFELTTVITKMVTFREEGQDWVLLMLDGSTSIFHLPLKTLLSSDTPLMVDASSLVVVTQFDAPVLGISLSEDSLLYVSTDTRADVVSRPELRKESHEVSRGLHVLTLKDGKFLPAERDRPDSVAAISQLGGICPPGQGGQQDSGIRTWVEPDVAAAMLLYTALTTYPKHASEASSGAVVEVARKQANRKARGKRARGREENRRRLEQALN